MIALALGQRVVRLLSLVFINPPKIKECERPTGPERSLDDWREDIVRSRKDILNTPGLYLDRSPTGSGKSTADIEAVRRVERALIVTPTHENGSEIEEDMQAAGISAMKYPSRSVEGKFPNCVSPLADISEALGLSVIAAVCPGCGNRAECLRTGYLAQLDAVKHAAVAIATHQRAVYQGIGNLAEGRGQFIAIHEDVANTICPDAVLRETDLQKAADIVGRLLTDPAWLNWFGQAASQNEDGTWTKNEKLAAKRSKLDAFTRQLADLIDVLLVELRTAEKTHEVKMPSPIEKATGIESLLLRATLESKARFRSSPWRLLLAVLAGELHSLGVIVDDRRDVKPKPAPDGTKKQPDPPTDEPTKFRTLAGLWKNLPSENATVLFCDATADRDDLESLLGRKVADVTPPGHLTTAKRVVQFPIDVTRHTSPQSFLSVLRGVLTEFRDARRVGLITHRPLVSVIKKLGEPFSKRIVKTAHFGSGSDRASNGWHHQCDLIVVLGTPRVPGEAVQRRLIQFGNWQSASEDGRWGDVRWRGLTDTKKEVIVTGKGYEHPAWERAHRSLVRAAIVQAAGRGRSLLETGCDVVVISTEECGFPVTEKTEIGLSESEAAVLDTLAAHRRKSLSNISKTSPPMRTVDCSLPSTAEIARQVRLSERQTRDILAKLATSFLVTRIGERGGWRLADAWLLAGGGTPPSAAGVPVGGTAAGPASP